MIDIQKNFLDSKLLADIKLDLDFQKSQSGWASYRFLFSMNVIADDPDITGDFHVCKISDDIRHRIEDFLIHSETLSDMDIRRENLDPKFIFYYCSDTNSGLGWHTDESMKVAISLYLNDDWDPDWGGLFCYKDPWDQETVHQIVPEKNKAVIMNGPVWHKVSRLQPEAPVRESLQILIKKDK